MLLATEVSKVVSVAAGDGVVRLTDCCDAYPAQVLCSCNREDQIIYVVENSGLVLDGYGVYGCFFTGVWLVAACGCCPF